jgi:hypothetical protein
MKSELRLKQEEFARAVGQLLLYAWNIDIKVTLGDAYRDPRLHGEVGVKMGYGSSRSCHKSRLAIDLNANEPSDYEKLHDFWDHLGGSARIAGDMNHFSFEWRGMR